MGANQAKAWLEQFASHFQRALRRSPASRSVMRYPAVGPEPTESEGWFAPIAHVKGGGVFSAFLDRSAGRTERHVWYGFSSRDRERIEAITRSSGQAPIRDSTPRRLTANEFGALFLEHAQDGEHYVGVYLLDATEAHLPPAPYLVGRVMRETEHWFVALADLDISEAPPASTESGEECWVNERVRQEVLARRGQANFRRNLLMFGAKCCVTQCELESLLEAAHIETFVGRDDHSCGNGLLLRSDIHTLWDAGLLAIDPDDLAVHVAPDVTDPVYRVLHGGRLRLHKHHEEQLNRDGLRRRWSQVGWHREAAR